MAMSCTVFDILDFKKAATLKHGLGGHSRSLEMTLFDRAHMTSAWCQLMLS